MKLSNLIWVLALAAAVAGCNSGPPIDNAPGGTAGTGGSGGTASSERDPDRDLGSAARGDLRRLRPSDCVSQSLDKRDGLVGNRDHERVPTTSERTICKLPRGDQRKG